MAVRIRLQRKGRKKRPFYHIVVADHRAPRDGKFIERLGSYNPMTKPATIELDHDKAFDWIMKGAQPSDTARAILRFKGVYFRKHLQRGVTKGAMTQEEADSKYNEWVEAKEEKIAARFQQTAEEIAAYNERISGTPRVIQQAVEEEVEESAQEEEAPVAEAENAEAPEAEVAVAEEPVEEPAAEEEKKEE